MVWWAKTVVLLSVAIAPCIAIIKELDPGQVWPERGSVKQPSDWIQNVTDVESEPLPSLPDVDDDPVDENPEVILKTVDLSRDEVHKVDYTGAQVWQIPTQKPGVRTILMRLRRRNLISTWGGNQSSIDVLVKPNSIQNVTRIMKRENITYDVVIDDLQKRIDEENPPLDQNELELQDRRGHRMTWKQYHRLDDIHGFMDYVAKTYPSIVSVKSIGKSYENRNLKLLRISDGKPTNKAVFIDGGIHAREWISPATVTYFINQFAENFDVESDDIKNIDWYFLPVLNPDGYEYSHTNDRLWRKNRKPTNARRDCVGTDLNRNFGYHWGGTGASTNPCVETYRGREAFSEPESKALSEFIKNSAVNFSAYLTYHSFGQYLLYPWGYDNEVPPDFQQLDDVGNKMAQAIQQTGGSVYRVGSSSGLLYPASGGSDDWAKAQGIKYSYTIELSDTGRYGFILPTSYIEPVAKESLAGLRVLANQGCHSVAARVHKFWRYRAFNRRLGLVGSYMGYYSVDLPMEYWPNANWGHRMTWKQYHRLDDIHGFMDYLAKTYPSIVSVKSIGKTYEGRDLKLLRISDGKPTNKAVFIDGGIHAREWISPATVTYFINQFAENFDVESDDIKNIDWYFLPVLNPDGYEYTHRVDRVWRKNRKPAIAGRACLGTDLNRNFGYHWGGKGASSNPCAETYRGRGAFSEPESKALSEFIKNSAVNFSAYLTYHSYGQYLLYPWGYDNVVPPDYQQLNDVGNKMAQAIQQTGGSVYSVGSSSGLLYPASGGSDDWAKAQGIKYSYTIELSDTGRYGFILPTSYIEPVARESLAGLRVLANQVHKG